MTVLIVLGVVFLVVVTIRRYRRRRPPVGRVTIDRYGPERAIFPREPIHRETRRRRYRG